MSLLHKALKKAEREGTTAPSGGAFIDTEESPKSSSLRMYLLASLSVVALLSVAYVRFFRAPSVASTTIPAVKKFETPIGIAGGGSADQLSSEAKTALEKGDLEGARSRFEKVVILQPRSAEAYNNLGLVLKKMSRNEEAFEQYRKALSLDPNCVECLNNLGVLYLSDRDLGQAETHFYKAIELLGTRQDYADPYLHMGLLLEARGDLAGAKKNYLKFVELAHGVKADLLFQIQKRIASLQSP